MPSETFLLSQQKDLIGKTQIRCTAQQCSTMPNVVRSLQCPTKWLLENKRVARLGLNPKPPVTNPSRQLKKLLLNYQEVIIEKANN